MNEDTNVNQPDFAENLERRLELSIAGRKANSRGKLTGALLGKASGAERAAGYDNNLWTIGGVPVRFHSVAGGKMNFSVNPVTEPASLIVAFSEGEPQNDKPLRHLLYGLKLKDCIAGARPTKSGTAPGRLHTSLSQVRHRERLGNAYLPARYTEAETVADRMDLMDAIDQLPSEELETMMDATTKQKIREFVLASRVEPVGTVESDTLPPQESVEIDPPA